MVAAAVAQLNRINLAAFLLLVAATRHYGWLFVDPQDRGIISKALGAIAAICLIVIIWQEFSSKLVSLVLAYYAFEETQTALCSVAYYIKPWTVLTGQSICSAYVGFEIGLLGIFIVSIIALVISLKSK